MADSELSFGDFFKLLCLDDLTVETRFLRSTPIGYSYLMTAESDWQVEICFVSFTVLFLVSFNFHLADRVRRSKSCGHGDYRPTQHSP